MGLGLTAEAGVLGILRGSHAGNIYAFEDFGLHVGVPAVSGGIKAAALYYSGPISNLHPDQFFGMRYELNIGFDVGVSVTATGSLSYTLDGNFVIGIGSEFGLGASLTILDVNGGLGKTKRSMPWRGW